MKWRNTLRVSALLTVIPLVAMAGSQISVSKPWIRYLLPNIPAAGYMVLQNTGDADAVLTGAESPACGMLMLHKSQDDSGVGMMMDVQSVTIPAHGSVAFVPGSYHLMCMNPVMKIGKTVHVSLMFQDGPGMAVTMQVYGAQGAP